MYLKSLELMGFKSFGKKTVFDFTPGITAIIGPNGSGKSNVCDAIRWVLGEQSAKALRGTRMPDVIFAGSNDHRGAAFAQVKLVLDNEDKAMPIDFAEVDITRQLFRSNESNYILNGTKTRLSDLKELLMDTGIGKDGYSVIGQGDIDDIIFQKIQPRRVLIEEAAGITKFKHRKQNALTKLEQTRTNMTRITDIIAEIDTQLGPLAEQAEKTKKYQALSIEIKELEIDLILYDLQRLRGDKENIASMRLGLLAKIEEIEKFLEEVEGKKSASHLRFAEFEDVLNGKQDEVRRVVVQIEEQRALLAALRENLRSNEARSEAIVEELAGIDRMLGLGEDEIERAQGELVKEETSQERVSVRMAEVSQKADEARAELDKHLMEQTHGRDSMLQAAIKLTDCKNRMNTASQQMQILERQLDKGETDVSTAKELLQRLEDENVRVVEEIAVLKAEIDENKAKLNNELVALSKANGDYKRVEEELVATTDQIKIAQARSNILEELKYSGDSGIYRGVQAVLALKETGRLPGIHGIVGDLIKVPNGYEIAIETALGGSIQDIIAQDSDTAKEAIAALKANRAGRATFLPLDIIKAPSSLEESNARGCLGVALDLVEFDAKYYTAMSNLLGRIYIFDNLDNAVAFTRSSRNFNRIVTLDGEIVRSSGAMTGGGEAKKAGGILSRKREREDLGELLENLAGREKRLRLMVNKLNEERQRLTISTQGLDEHVRRREQSLEFFERNKEKNGVELAQKTQDFTHLKEDRAELTSKLKAAQQDYKQAEKEFAGIEKENEEISEKLKGMGGLTSEIQHRYNELNNEHSDLKIELAQVTERQRAIKREIEAAIRRKNESAERKERAATEIQRLKDASKEQEEQAQLIVARMDELEKEKGGLEGDMEGVQTEYRQMSKELEQLDKAYQSRVRIEDSTRSKLSELDIKLAEINTHISTKEGILAGEFNVAVEEQVLPIGKYESRDELVGRTSALNFEQQMLEPINPLAVEDYNKTKERYDFLNEQVSDMEEAASSLEQVIAEIDKISSERFLETFGQINVAFNDIFEILFPGGTGSLKLTEKDTPLTSNVDIVCKLPGKKLSTLELFSGGEKTLISLAMLFAILQVKPPAFCLLDEAEAALDESNVKRFNRMLRSFANKTQFLVITHNKLTMQAVDVIYGVTMQKGGISRQISIRLEDEEQIKEYTVGKGQVTERSMSINTDGLENENERKASRQAAVGG
jgi:chromosome segregation protein